MLLGNNIKQAKQIWRTIAMEGQTIKLNTTNKIRFGAGLSWIEKNASIIQCSTEGFEGDPIFGVGKRCEVYTKP